MSTCIGSICWRLKSVIIFLLGGGGYAILELLFRRYTHWSMVIAGGICAVILYKIAVKSKEALWKKWIMSGAVITTVEFLTGIAVNILLGWNVWDYSEQWANLFGQICVSFSFLWVMLSIPGIWIMRLADFRLNKETT